MSDRNNNDSAGNIVQMLWNRCEEALELIAKLYEGLIKVLSRRILGNEQDVEECFNDVLLEIWETIPPNCPVSIGAYVSMLTRRRSIDKLRHANAQKMPQTDYYSSVDELADVAYGESAQSEDNAGLVEALNDFLAGLNERDRSIFMSRYYGFESVADIAKAYFMTENALNVKLFRIRSKLRDHLTERNIII